MALTTLRAIKIQFLILANIRVESYALPIGLMPTNFLIEIVSKHILISITTALVALGCTNASVEVGDTQITIQEEKEPLKIYINQMVE
jgi:hypothetical protein